MYFSDMSCRQKFLRVACFFLTSSIFSASFFLPSSLAKSKEAIETASSRDATKSTVPVEVVADSLEYKREQKKITATGNVVVTYKNLKLQADRAEVFTGTKIANAEGHVTVFDGKSSLSGEKAEYNFQNRSGIFPHGKGYQFPWYAYGESIEQISKDEFRVKNGTVTTCNLENPHYDLIAKDVTVYPNDKIVLKNAFLRILKKKVFWIPYMTIPLDERESPIEIKTGYSSNYGFYILTAKGFSLSKNVKIKGHVDYRTQRGIAGGVDLGYGIPNFGRGKVITYLIDDKRAPTPGRENPFTDRQKETRYRLTVRHRTDFEPGTSAIVNWHEFSDEFLLQEFFQREDRVEARPKSQVVFTRTRDDYSLFAEIAKRSNKFFSEIEKLPRANFTWKNQPLFDTNLLYTHESQFTNFQKRIGRRSISSIDQTPFPDSSADQHTIRLDTSHQIQYPFRAIDNRLKFTPYANIREAYYSRGRFENGIGRSLLGYGVETRTRFQRTFDFSSNFMNIQVNKLRHILEPIFRYDAIRLDTAAPEKLFQMDAFDELHRHDVFTVELDNRFQTKRSTKDGIQRVDIVSYNTFVNYELDGGRNGGSTLTDWGNQVTVRPYDWLLLEAKTIFDFNLTDFRESLFDIVLEPSSKKVRLILSQGYLRKDPSLSGSVSSNIFMADLMYKINELWQLGGYVRTDLVPGKVEEWEVRAIRDLHDFLLTFGFNARNSDFRGKSSNKEAFVEFTMKAFPSLSLGVGNRSSITRPRIGRYYDGSNAEEETLPSSYYGAF